MLNNIKAVIFDLDGTLVDSMGIWKNIDIEYLGKFGLELPSDLQSCIEGMSFSETAVYFKERFQIEDSIEKMKQDWNDMAYEQYMNHVPMKPGALEFLTYLKKNNIKAGIATSNSVELVQSIIAAHKLTDYFNVIKTSCEAKAGKPEPDIYLLVANCLGVTPEECLVFEDIIPGIQGGLNAGMKVCGIEDDYSKDTREEKKKLAHYYINDYYEILNTFTEYSDRMEK